MNRDVPIEGGGRARKGATLLEGRLFTKGSCGVSVQHTSTPQGYVQTQAHTHGNRYAHVVAHINRHTDTDFRMKRCRERNRSTSVISLSISPSLIHFQHSYSQESCYHLNHFYSLCPVYFVSYTSVPWEFTEHFLDIQPGNE